MDTLFTLKNVEDLVGPVLDNLGYELIERELVMESGRWVLRLYIDKDGGVGISDCERVSHSVEDLIEVEGVIPHAYSLEVSSPGINRPLRRKRDFEKYKGHNIKLRTLEPINGRGNYRGALQGIDGDDIVMTIDGVEFRIPYDALAKARLQQTVGRGT